MSVIQAIQKTGKPHEWTVTLDSIAVGRIVYKDGSYQYIPKGQRKGGDKFDHLLDCLRSLRGEGA